MAVAKVCGIETEYGIHHSGGDGNPVASSSLLVNAYVSDLARVVSETARVLKPGGLYLFDTINRTLKSKLLVIKAMQQWPLTRITDAVIHDWDMFIKPTELAVVLGRHGLETGEMVGLGPRAKLPAALRGLIAARRGRITYGEFSRRLDIGQVRGTAVSYMGFATKAR